MDRKEVIKELVERDLESAVMAQVKLMASYYLTEQYEEMPTSQLEDILQSYEDIDGLFGGA